MGRHGKTRGSQVKAVKLRPCQKCNGPFLDAFVLWPDGKKYRICERCRRDPELIRKYRGEARNAPKDN